MARRAVTSDGPRPRSRPLQDAPTPDRWARPGLGSVVTTEVAAWTEVDGAPVAVVVRFPDRPLTDPTPVVVLSHGLGGDHAGYACLGRHLASHGYIVLHPQFLDAAANAARSLGVAGFDERNWMHDPQLRAAMLPMLFDSAHWLDRVRRVHAVLDSLATQRHVPVRARPDRVVVAGHSYGAFTTQLLLGTRLFVPGLDDTWFAHPAVAGGALLSPQGSGDRGLTSRSWDDVRLPLLVVTATNDLGPHGEGLEWRREPYDAAASRPKFLAVVRGGDHLLGGSPFADDPPDAGAGTRLAVAALVTAFADRVNGDRAAGRWLAAGPFSPQLHHEHVGGTAP